MKKLKIASFIILFLLLSVFTAEAAYIKNHPVQLTQPDGSVFYCYASGDEYYNFLHDEYGNIIVLDEVTGYYCYAQVSGNEITATPEIFGRGPVPEGLHLANANDEQTLEIIRKIAEQRMKSREGFTASNFTLSEDKAKFEGEVNSIIVFVRFSDDDNFSTTVSMYDEFFNSEDSSFASRYSYFKADSADKLKIKAVFQPVQPTSSNSYVNSYKDTYKRGYYEPYSSLNTIGYKDYTEGNTRLMGLISRISDYLESRISGINIDSNSDGYFDDLIIVIKGEQSSWSDILWPTFWRSESGAFARIKNKNVCNFTIQIENYLKETGSTVLCHETSHLLGFPDYYHYYSNKDFYPVYTWDIMETNTNPPQFHLAYSRMLYGRWISEIPEITTSGQYTLSPMPYSTTNAYKIKSSENEKEYFIVEYRKRGEVFDSKIPGSGLIVYRINTVLEGKGNVDGPPDEIMVFCPLRDTNTDNGDPHLAFMSEESGRTSAGKNTSIKLFYSDGTQSNIVIKDVSYAGDTISFYVDNGVTVQTPIDSLAVGDIDSDSVELTFPAPVGADEIIVEQSKDGGATWEVSDIYSVLDSSSTSAIVINLEDNTDYLFRINVKGGLYEGCSNTVSARTLTKLTLKNTFLQINSSCYEVNFDLICNTDEELGRVRVFCAFYDGAGGLKGVKMQYARLDSGSELSFYESLPFDEKVTEVKVCAWDEQMRPLSNAVTESVPGGSLGDY